MVYLLLANGFEEIEALTPVDILRRGGVDITTLSIHDTPQVTGAHGIVCKADGTLSAFLKETKMQMPIEMLILPGGMPGAKHLDESTDVDTMISVAKKQNAYLAAICAAPMVYGHRGLLAGKKATCYPSFEPMLLSANICDDAVVQDGRIITANAMGAALQFSLKLLQALRGDQCAEKVKASILA